MERLQGDAQVAAPHLTDVNRSQAEPPAGGGRPARSLHRRRRAAGFGEKFGLLVLFVVVLVFFGLWGKTSATFFSHADVVQIIGNQMVMVLVGLAAMLPLNSGALDLSVGASVGCASVACATCIARFGTGVPIAIVVGILVALLVGLIDGVLIARFKLSAVITTLAMGTALTGLMEWYTAGNTITVQALGFERFGALNWLGIPRLAFVVVPILLAILYLQEWTPWGRYQQAINGNERAARLVGLSVDRVVLTSFILGGLMAGIAGVLLVARSAEADSTTGPSYMFPALTAVFLGATTIRPGRANALGTLVGVFFVAFSVAGLTLAGASSWVSDVFDGLILFVAAGLATVFARERGARRLF